jgi:hypothetical protein
VALGTLLPAVMGGFGAVTSVLRLLVSVGPLVERIADLQEFLSVSSAVAEGATVVAVHGSDAGKKEQSVVASVVLTILYAVATSPSSGDSSTSRTTNLRQRTSRSRTRRT